MDGTVTTSTEPERSLVTSLGIIEGEVLLHLDVHGATPMRRLIRDLEWSSPLVTMALGALIREGLVRARQHELELIIEPKRPALISEAVPEAWGG
ncbi:MAG: hypothetical protein A3B78_02720 [Omnitrophica WOR_2 bacterium RIFCSPHIGHO2_02_FULL_67_20]|nr:MAG: hypothetical protein A3B78_02720 [Omnitrophica WOR_2 bacterium RIFCSPHIGHO2_02_FULL_67_20]